jgi:biotin transport system substrate-specific component
MTRVATQVLHSQDGVDSWTRQAAILVLATVFVAICAHISIPLPFTPVPLTLQNFAVLLVGVRLGSRRGFAVLALYLMEGITGLPVFNPIGPGGLAQILGPTGGFLMVYPLVAAIAGFIAERGTRSFARTAVGCLLAELVLFAGGIGWLAVLTHSASLAMRYGFYWFVFAEIIKVMMVAGLSTEWRLTGKSQL